jgi:hypothetical protein
MVVTRRRSEAFFHALTVVRERLSRGVYPAETRLSAGELAAELQLSPTPIREVLARFVGEGLLVDRPGQGCFVPRHSAREVADLYRLNLAHLQIALAMAQAAPNQGGALGTETPIDDVSAIAAVDKLFGHWVIDAGSRLLARSYGRLQLQLAPVRRREAQLLDDLVGEYAKLAGLGAMPGPRRLPSVRAFFRRRVRYAARLAERLEPPSRVSRTLLSKDFE